MQLTTDELWTVRRALAAAYMKERAAAKRAQKTGSRNLSAILMQAGDYSGLYKKLCAFLDGNEPKEQTNG